MTKVKIAILKNEIETDHYCWLTSCEKVKDKILYETIDLTKNNWLEQITDFKPNILLIKPGGLTAPFKQLYDERLFILVKELGYKAFPSLDEVLIYENKRYFSYWLQAHHLPHPKTNVSYFKKEALQFLKNVKYPLIGKVNIGASGSGVTILKNHEQAKNYITRTFSGRGAKKRLGPNFKKGGLFRRTLRYFEHPGRLINKLKIYEARASDIQKDFIIFQEYVDHEFEWRVVRIGDSFFAHKKLKKGEKASGTLLKNYDNPSLSILDFVKEITDRFGFYSQAVDIFETDNGYLINEMQCIFGQSDGYQMLIDGNPGRYLYVDNKWLFEPGDFNTNESYDLRLETAMELYSKGTR